jgi:hypothetical protein
VISTELALELHDEETAMTAEYGPYVQMGKLAQQMAVHCEKDKNLSLEPLLAHFLEEVEVNLAADSFDHEGFLRRVQGSLKSAADVAADPRQKEFLLALVDALRVRINQEVVPAVADKGV